MKLFCKICNNILEMRIVNNELEFLCISCNSHYEADADDSLRYEDIKGTDIAIFKPIINKLSEDIMNPKVQKACGNCPGQFARYVRLGDDKKIIYSCIECKSMSF